MLKLGVIRALFKSPIREQAEQIVPKARGDVVQDVERVLTGTEQASPPATSEAERFEAAYGKLKPAFAAKDGSIFGPIIRQEYALDAVVVFDPAVTLHPTCFILAIHNARAKFRFATTVTHDALTVMIVERLWSILPLVKRLVSSCADSDIEVIFNLNDEGVEEGLTFCDNRPEFTLIPDSVFVGMKGYDNIKNQYALQNIDWNNKQDIVFWRGTSTGRPWGSRQELPRISLCRLCRPNASGVFDVGLTALVDHHANDAEGSELRSLISDHVPWHEFDRYRYHIDIDGHTNSWPGLMFKLHSGGLVFKVEPQVGHRQWYYDRLKPWENYIPVKSDMSDLLDLVTYIRSNEKLGRSIAEEGRRLALSMDISAELDVGVRAILAHCARQQYRRLSST